ncbi:uncharacterized protein METZ01_LOCUS27881 [marine metagenome]|uniref:Uncharacterized protein n=1 Tax=marine metagenome TaxID=408172 RepID=A0A381QAC9_9ZZZZ
MIIFFKKFRDESVLNNLVNFGI